MKQYPPQPEFLPYNRRKQHILDWSDIRTTLIRKLNIRHHKETIWDMWVFYDYKSRTDTGKRKKHSLIVETYIPKYKNIDDEIEDRINLHTSDLVVAQ